MGNPGVNLLVPGALLTDARPMGEDGKHVRFTVEAGGGRCRAVAFGCDGRLPVNPDTPADATFRLERNSWNGAVEPRLRLRHAQACAPEPIEVLGEPAPDAWLPAVLAQTLLRAGPVRSDPAHPDAPVRPSAAGRASSPPPARSASAADGLGPGRVVIDRRGESALTVLRDLAATGERVLAVVADVPRRIEASRPARAALRSTSHAALARHPGLADPFEHLVDPRPACPSRRGGPHARGSHVRLHPSVLGRA